MSEEQIELHFPGITNSGYAVRSPATKEYDCVAWAAGDTEAWWWPDPLYVSYWPLEVPREENIEAFVKAFERLGYSCCGEAAPEKTYEKIAIYVDSRRKPTHVARQLKSGRWISKLGGKEDIEHELDAFIDSEYGEVRLIMKRPRKEKSG